jgi:ABC-type transport system involved in multi-copper enzyme maturation permease subunit
MFKTLLLKEIHESVMNFRFWLITLLCLILIPLGLYIASKNYQSMLDEYQINEKKYIEQTLGTIGGGDQMQGFFQPSPLSIFSSGFRDYLPVRAITSNDGFVTIEKKLQDGNLQSVLFGKIDFVFIITNFLSLLALIFTFGSISYECEQGTLKLLLSNQVPRWKLITAKILGNYFVFLAPFIVSIILGLVIIQWITGINFLSSPLWPNLLMILVYSMLFLFMFFNLGIWASIISRNTIMSIVILLFIWIFLSLIIPRISPMIAQVIFPVKTEDAYLRDSKILKQQIEKQFDNERRDLLKRVINENEVKIKFASGMPDLSEITEKETNYSQLVKPIDKKYETELNQSLGKLEKEYSQSKFHQMEIAANLSRISPVSSFTYLITELSNTGILEYSNRQKAASDFQLQVNQDIYSKYLKFRYVYEGLVYCGTKEKGEKWPTQNVKVPVMTQHRSVPLSTIFLKTWPDFVLLIWFTVFFFIAAFVSFIRFDVR